MASWHQPRANRRVRAPMGSARYPVEPHVVAPVGSGKAPHHVSDPIIVAPLKRPLDKPGSEGRCYILVCAGSAELGGR